MACPPVVEDDCCCDKEGYYLVKPRTLVCPELKKIECDTLLYVCGGGSYNTVDEAWKKTGIPPHKLRWMANNPAFPNVYWL